MTERQIEEYLLAKLEDLKYTYRPEIRDRNALEANFRAKFEELNRVSLSNHEFERLMQDIITPDVFKAANILRVQNTLERDDGTPLHYTLVNTKDWCKNDFEVVNQLRINTTNSHHRYDVILLINGVPVVQIELKNLPINPHRAMQQIVRYKNDPGNGYGNTLLCFLQLFIVSNSNDTWYFANNNKEHFSFSADERFLPLYQFAGKDNRKITHLDEFAKAFLAKCTLGRMISRYMVLVASEDKMMMMRPYQIYAVQAIVECIQRNSGNGYIWHTTGSGKTLTSFKASTLLKDNPEIEKCLFVVDRKDLDRQTREEFNRFQEGCVEENTNTETLVQRLLSTDYSDKVIVTTIQKLGLALDGTHKKNYKERLEPLRNKRMVFIFDECHRSQFGENHKSIKEFFPNSQLFGFTGTPIFEGNSTFRQVEGEYASFRTTEDLFQQCLHQYTITHAIEDRNVLRFHVDYFEIKDKSTFSSTPEIKNSVIDAIYERHDKMTANRKFNALFATASINDAIDYYQRFMEVEKHARAQRDYTPLNIACVFSPPAEGSPKNRAEIRQIQEDLPQEKIDNKSEPEKKKAALKQIIADYNEQFGTNCHIGDFDAYYQDVQKRIKDQQFPNSDLPHEKKVDIVIVVDMLLTGFDSKYLNTLYVDKNLRYHGLIQAFSRTNRVLNDTKPAGNILDFRGQEDAVNEAITMFSGEFKDRAKTIWLVDPAPAVIAQYEEAVANLKTFMQSQDLECTPQNVPQLRGNKARAQFINTYKEVQRLHTQLGQYTDLDEGQKEQIASILPEDDVQGFKGVYLTTAQRLQEEQGKTGGDATPEQQEIDNLDFELVLFSSAVIDYDYIMTLLARFSQAPARQQKMRRQQIIDLICSDAKFMDEREEIVAYVETLQEGEGLTEEQLRQGFETFKTRKHADEVAALAQKFGLQSAALQEFIDGILLRMIFDGEQLTDLMAPLELGWKQRALQERALMDELTPLLNRRANGRNISGLEAYE